MASGNCPVCGHVAGGDGEKCQGCGYQHGFALAPDTTIARDPCSKEGLERARLEQECDNERHGT